ncbi:MAG: glutamine--fructose-6-phosphate transaminase (isomerizing) [Dehalococcoidia bacterium]|nr:glutamine--fructose-6-phosphate transaminase (isomerizing) [Dehalococcoidia bacterium]
MCGIFAYVGPREAAPLLLEGLRRVEYRGYDSAGVAVANARGAVHVRKAAGKLDSLARLVAADAPAGSCGIGHTRWATHGKPTDDNAHPHTDPSGRVAAVHNGIVENHLALKRRLTDAGRVFASATDSEVIPHLVEARVSAGADLADAVRAAAAELDGANAVVCLDARDPRRLVAVRLGNAGGLAVGYGDGEMFVASDLPALAGLAARALPLAPGQVADVTPEGARITDLSGKPTAAAPLTLPADAVAAAKGGYRHFMLKETHEQPEAAMNALRGRIAFDSPALTVHEAGFTDAEAAAFKRVVLVGMGTSLFAAQLGALYLEELARIPASAEDASEFRYRRPVLDRETLVVAVAQSGETADTLEAMHAAQTAGARLLAVVNAEGSQATRLAGNTLLLRAGPEIAVASTKTFTNALVCLLLTALELGQRRGVLDEEAVTAHVGALAHLPALLGEAIALNDGAYPRLAKRYGAMRRFLYVGRGRLLPIALEGAMKLKEVSYIHAEGMSAAMMKHGPIALVDKETPVVALAPAHGMRDKMLANINEVAAREGPVLAVATAGDDEVAALASDVLWTPPGAPLLEPIAAAIPLQLLAYHVALHTGADVDQPRNLAKSVTVE